MVRELSEVLRLNAKPVPTVADGTDRRPGMR